MRQRNAVKQEKFLLLRAVGNVLLTQAEMVTMLIEVEAVLKCGLIPPLSPDLNDGEALTPAHLILGESLSANARESQDDVRGTERKLYKRWRLLCNLKQIFWQAWSRDYVLGIQSKSKWHQEAHNLEVGQLVIEHEDNRPHWLTGKVMAVVKGEDAKVGVAEVATSNGVPYTYIKNNKVR